MVQKKKLLWRQFVTREIKRPSSREIYTTSFTKRTSEDASVASSFDLNLVPSLLERSFEKVIKTFLLVVVYECLDRLYMLTNVYSSFVNKYEVTQMDYKSLKDRFGDSEANYAEYQINLIYSDKHKLQKEIAVSIFLLDTLITEVKTYGTFTSLTECMENMIKMRKDEDILRQQVKDQKKLLEYVRWAHVKERLLSANVVNTYNNSIKKTVRAYQDQSENARMEVEYAKKWNDARYEQNLLQLQKREKIHSSTSDKMRLQIQLEDRCHVEVELFMEESYKDYMEQIETWMEQYETAIENKEVAIYNLKTEIEKVHDNFETLQKKYEERTKEIEDYLEHKKLKKEQEKLMAMKNWAATKIQAWWRGVMVRRKLGPFKKPKGKKGKGKAGKSKK